MSSLALVAFAAVTHTLQHDKMPTFAEIQHAENSHRKTDTKTTEATAESVDSKRKTRDLLRATFGLQAGRGLWGLEPIDLRPGLGPKKFSQSGLEDPRHRHRAHSTDGLFHSEHLRELYSVPLRRHVWGEPQYELHAAWGELFLDLIFVGAAYRLGGVVKDSFCDASDAAGSGSASGSASASASASASGSIGDGSGSASSSGSSGGTYGRLLGSAAPGPTGDDCPLPGLGVLYCAALFLCSLRIWLCDLHYRARFEAQSRFHKLLDLLGYLLLVYAAANMQSVHLYLTTDSAFGFFVISFLAAHGLWILRWLELALLSLDEETRRFSSLRLVDDTPAMAWWVGAWVLQSHHPKSFGVPVLLIVGSLWTDVRLHWRVHRAAFLHACDPGGEIKHMTKDRTRVPMNVEFAIHRFNEFMMLMVGEGVLQLVISDTVGGIQTSFYNIALVSGFVLAVTMLYSWNVTEPHHATGHAFARSSRPAALYLLLMPPNAFAILLAGIGVKMVFVDPARYLQPGLEFEQRLLVSTSLAACFVLQLVRQPLHVVGLLNYYGLRRQLENKPALLFLLLRVATIVTMVGLSFVDGTSVVDFLLMQCIGALFACGFHHMQVHFRPDADDLTAHHGHHTPASWHAHGGHGAHPAHGAHGTHGAHDQKAGDGAHRPSTVLWAKAADVTVTKRKNRKKASCMIQQSFIGHVQSMIAARSSHAPRESKDTHAHHAAASPSSRPSNVPSTSSRAASRRPTRDLTHRGDSFTTRGALKANRAALNIEMAIASSQQAAMRAQEERVTHALAKSPSVKVTVYTPAPTCAAGIIRAPSISERLSHASTSSKHRVHFSQDTDASERRLPSLASVESAGSSVVDAEPLGAEQSEMSSWIAEASEVGAQVALVRKPPEGVLGGAGACASARARGAAGGSGGASPGRV